MRLLLIRQDERWNSEGKLLRFYFKGTEEMLFRAEISEFSGELARWYGLAMDLAMAAKKNADLWVSGLDVKPETCEIKPESQFSVEIIETEVIKPPTQRHVKSYRMRRDWGDVRRDLND